MKERTEKVSNDMKKVAARLKLQSKKFNDELNRIYSLTSPQQSEEDFRQGPQMIKATEFDVEKKLLSKREEWKKTCALL